MSDMTFDQAHGIVLGLLGQHQALSRLKDVLETAAKAEQVESGLRKRRAILEMEAEKAKQDRDAAVARATETVRLADEEMSRELERLRLEHARNKTVLQAEIAMLESQATGLRKDVAALAADLAERRRAFNDEIESLTAQRDSAKSSLNQIKSQLAALARA